MLRVVDAGGREVTVSGPVVVVAGDDDLGTLLTVDVLRRTAQVLGLPASTRGVPSGLEAYNLPSSSPGPGNELVLSRPGRAEGEPADPLAARLAWAAGCSVEEAVDELDSWRRDVAAWAEEPSRPMCAQVQQDLLAALADDVDTRAAVTVLRGSLDLGLPPGALFETWAWADRMLALDLTRLVGR